MRKDVLMSMDADALDRYAAIIGANTTGMAGIADKVSAIIAKRERTHELQLLGETFIIPTRNIRDKRFQDALADGITDSSAEAAARLALGDEQWERLIERATDEDAIVDVDALGMAIAQILNAPELKNY